MLDVGSYSVLYNVSSNVANTMVPAVFVGSYHPVLAGCESHTAAWQEAEVITLSKCWWACHFTGTC